MITVQGLTLHFGPRPIFDDISFFIGSEDRIGLVGRNGAGKSTLLKIMAGQQPFDTGTIGKPRELTLGYLPQEMAHNLELTPWQVAEKAFEEAITLNASLERIEKDLEKATTDEEAIELATLLAHAHERLNTIGAADHDMQIERMLKGIGFVEKDMHRLMSEMSGGWRMRAELARLLLIQPDLLLLDEPTNHLDLPAIQWLEDLLRTYPAALVLISHDKTFLDRLTKRTLEVIGGKLIDRKVPWSQYVELRKVEREQQASAAKDQQRYIKETTDLINKFRAKASKAAFAQSLITKLDKLERIEVDDEDLRKMLVKFPPAPTSGKIVAEVKGVSKTYPDRKRPDEEKQIFRNAELTIAKGEHLALVGANGTGKSTLVRMIMREEPFEGEIKLGHNVIVGYYAQDMPERMNPASTVMETAEYAASEDNRPRIRAMLGAFMFSGDDVDKKVKVLSGGERARLALCCMLLKPLNFLILDEPTHHLDIQSKDVLKEALKSYDGTFLLVSHDRDFLHGLTNRLLELDDLRIRDQHMDILELIEKRKALQGADIGKSSAAKAKSAKEKKADNSDHTDKRDRDKERRRVQSQVQRLEKQLAELEQEEKQLQAAVMKGGTPAAEVQKGYERMGEIAQRIAATMKEWEDASTKLEELGEEKIRLIPLRRELAGIGYPVVPVASSIYHNAMSSMRMPPRQKMINMMYLVLTAILALNVSKEVLDAFAVMDAELVRSERAHEQRSQLEYTVFADMAKQLPEKFGAKHLQALRVKAMADSLVRDIEGIKIGVVSKADGVDVSTLRGKDADGRDTLRALLALEMKDDRDVLTEALVGSEPASPREGTGTAHELRVRISAFRDSLKVLSAAKPELVAALDGLFDFSDRRDASGTMNNWESINFYDVPLAAGVATLSKLQADIRAAENDMVKWLYRSVEVEDYKFGTLTTAVVPQSNLIMAGDSFRADVFLAAYDPLNPPVITLRDGTRLPIGSDGKAKLRLRGNNIGEQLVEGRVRYEGPKGVEEFDYSTSYQVMAPLLVASPTKMNVLYRGVENPIDLSVPGVPTERVQATISTGRIVRTGNSWIATGMSGSTAEVNAMVPMPDGSMRRIGPVRFRVKNLPPPSPYIKDKGPSDTRIPLNELKTAGGVAVRTNTEFGDTWSAKSYTFTFQRGSGAPIVHECQGNAFTPGVKQVLDRARPGDKVFFEGINAQLTNGQGTVVKLAPIVLRVQ